jgi:hypothetical protein
MLKSKPSGSAEADAELDISSRSVRRGCACVVLAAGLLMTFWRRSSSVMFEVIAVE